jgi:hypothetical protein
MISSLKKDTRHLPSPLSAQGREEQKTSSKSEDSLPQMTPNSHTSCREDWRLRTPVNTDKDLHLKQIFKLKTIVKYCQTSRRAIFLSKEEYGSNNMERSKDTQSCIEKVATIEVQKKKILSYNG